jgi:hypothetical protein
MKAPHGLSLRKQSRGNGGSQSGNPGQKVELARARFALWPTRHFSSLQKTYQLSLRIDYRKRANSVFFH